MVFQMTEKRFQIIHLGNPYDFVVKDHQTNRTYGTLQGDDKSLMELLNELYEEVMDLRRENTKFKLTVSEIIEDMQKYIDDNQLVYINQSYVDWIKKEVDTTLYPQKKELKE